MISANIWPAILLFANWYIWASIYKIPIQPMAFNRYPVCLYWYQYRPNISAQPITVQLIICKPSASLMIHFINFKEKDPMLLICNFLLYHNHHLKSYKQIFFLIKWNTRLLFHYNKMCWPIFLNNWWIFSMVQLKVRVKFTNPFSKWQARPPSWCWDEWPKMTRTGRSSDIQEQTNHLDPA